ncbi:AbrB/MazE/SpoVT family DNA-binding domain-containing protein [Qipengyuania citrea]|uniref:AbrB/MazE/SpoVT family DNA-binding domain-containing protein n=1 Tax=Qipengyuania citrea TaxID=225971 RepID=UPI0032990BBA
MAIRIDIAQSGQMNLPVDVMERLGLSAGGTVYLDETDDGVVLRTLPQCVGRAQALARKYTNGKAGSSVDDFLAKRKVDSRD